MQHNADGFTSKAARLDEDARDFASKVQELEQAVERAQEHVAAQAGVVKEVNANRGRLNLCSVCKIVILQANSTVRLQVAKAQQLSAVALDWNRKATEKLKGARERKATTVEQQAALARAQHDLMAMEAQVRKRCILCGSCADFAWTVTGGMPTSNIRALELVVGKAAAHDQSFLPARCFMWCALNRRRAACETHCKWHSKKLTTI